MGKIKRMPSLNTWADSNVSEEKFIYRITLFSLRRSKGNSTLKLRGEMPFVPHNHLPYENECHTDFFLYLTFANVRWTFAGKKMWMLVKHPVKLRGLMSRGGVDICGFGYLFSVFVNANVENNEGICSCRCAYPVWMLISLYSRMQIFIFSICKCRC